jgi:hypothetical protein
MSEGHIPGECDPKPLGALYVNLLQVEHAQLKARVAELEDDKRAMIDDRRRIEDASKCPGDVDFLDHVELQVHSITDLEAKLAQFQGERDRWRANAEANLTGLQILHARRVAELEAPRVGIVSCPECEFEFDFQTTPRK